MCLGKYSASIYCKGNSGISLSCYIGDINDMRHDRVQVFVNNKEFSRKREEEKKVKGGNNFILPLLLPLYYFQSTFSSACILALSRRCTFVSSKVCPARFNYPSNLIRDQYDTIVEEVLLSCLNACWECDGPGLVELLRR